VTGVELRQTGAFNSSTSHLTLAYSPDASDHAPTRLILKRNVAAQWAKEAGEREVRFYTCDAYCSNFLCPRIPGQGPTYLLDWQSPEVNIGAIDLVNLCASFWTRQQRREGQREEMLLHRYHDNLLSHGVTDFSLPDLHTDYRIGLIDWIFYPVWDSNNGSDLDYWHPKMRCLLEAFQDWECATLLVP
jgi:hypothetical protein